MLREMLVLTIAITPTALLAQTARVKDQPRVLKGDSDVPDAQTNAAAAGEARIEVSKTAFVDGEEVCGVINITNSGGQPAAITGIADTLEVHFPSSAPSRALSAGSTRNWFRVADVPIPLPGPIAPGTTTKIDYCFPLCLAADFAGANSMRNVVTVTVVELSGRTKNFTTRSISFPPPMLDCRACCLPDGSCIDTSPDNCAGAGGASKEENTDCAETECTQACCFGDGSCSDETLTDCQSDQGEALGIGTECATAECPRGCCYSDGACQNQAPSACVAAGGRPHATPGSSCADTLGCPLACCRSDGTCDDVAPPFCLHPSTRLGPGTQCATSECPRGCCYPDGACEDQAPSECVAAGGRPHDAAGSTCADTLGCPLACCHSDGTCDDVAPPFCLPPNSTRLGPGTQCATSECPQPCCLDDGTCADIAPSACFAAGGRPLDQDQAHDCAEVAVYGGCPQACCVLGQCNNFFPLECAIREGELQGAGTSCTLDTCPRACCHDDGSCAEDTFSACQAAGGRPQSVHDSQGQHIGIDCGIVESNFGGCAVPCCFVPSGGCNTIPPDECVAHGGFPQGASDSCLDCAGACCLGGACEVLYWSECEAQGGDPQNPGTDCGFGPLSPCSVISP